MQIILMFVINLIGQFKGKTREHNILLPLINELPEQDKIRKRIKILVRMMYEEG